MGGSSRFQIIGGHLVSPADSQSSYINNGYNVNDTVYSVINLIMDKIRVTPWNLYKVVDEGSLKSYQAFSSKAAYYQEDFKNALNYKAKALEPLTGSSMATDKLRDLIKWPNQTESFSEFVGNGIGYKLITGNKFIWGNLLDSGANKGKPQELWNAPSQSMILYASLGWPSRPLGYKMIFWNQDYTVEQILHEKSFNPNWGINGTELYGMSPLKAALRLLNRDNSALDASSSQFQNQGLAGIVYVDDDRLQGSQAVAQAEAIKQKLPNEFTGPLNQGKLSVSGYKVGFTPLGLSPVELQIIEAEKWDLRKFCNVFGGVPSQLLNDPQNKTFNNQKEGEKAFTSRAVMPHLVAFRDILNKKLQSDWGYKGVNVYVDFDMSVFTELQQDMAEIGQWTSQVIAITPNEQRKALGMSALPDPMFDEPFILTQTRTPASDFQANMVDNALNENNNEQDNAQ